MFLNIESKISYFLSKVCVYYINTQKNYKQYLNINVTRKHHNKIKLSIVRYDKMWNRLTI